MAFKQEVQAPIFKRLFAFVIDVLIIDLVLLYPFSRVLSKVFSNKITASSLTELISGQFYLLFSITLIFLLYFILFEYRLGQTIGKMLVNLYSVSAEGKMTLWQAIGRNLFLIPVIPFVFLWVIDPLFIVWRSQSLSEFFTKTKTIEVQPWMKK